MNKGILGAKLQLFLRKLLAHYPDLTFSVPHKAIADNFAMPPSTVSKYLKLLVESGLVIQKEVEDIFKDKGVAKYRYQISDAGVKLVNSFASTNLAHQELIAQIQGDDFKTNLKELYKKQTLPEEDKRYAVNTDDCVLLLEVLLNQANQYGIVLRLTRSSLSNFVGFKVAKIQRLTKILRSLGLITQVTPGFSGFFGIQSSIYQLSLNHPLYAIEQQRPAVNVELRYAERHKLPADHLIGNILHLKSVNIDAAKGPVDIKASDEKGQKILEALNKLKIHLAGSKCQMITYCNSLMTIFASQVIRKHSDLAELIQLLTRGSSDEVNDTRVKMFNDLKEFLRHSLLSGTNKISEVDHIISALLPFFLDNVLHIALLLYEVEKLGYRTLASINTSIGSVHPPELKILLAFESKSSTEGIECSNYLAHFHQSRQNKQIRVRIEPDLNGLI